MPVTIKRARAGERAWHDLPCNVLERGLAELAHGTSHVALVASSSLTSERHQGRKVLTSSAAPREPGGPSAVLYEWST
jgi:hypothetical protein